jgi:hypothetical protein
MARDGVPPTVRDTPTKKGPGCGTVLLLGLAILALGAAALWLLVLRAPARAMRHVPSNANLVARVDLVEIALFGPVRKHLAPLFDAPPDPTAKASGAAERVDRVRVETGVDLRRDVREVVLASVDATGWVAIFGGRIERGRFVTGMERVLREDGGGAWRLEGDLLVGPLGVVMAQADDGAIVAGTDVSLVRAALPANDDAARLALPDGAVSMAITKAAWSGASRLTAALPHGSVLGRIEAATGRFALGDAPSLTMRAEATGGDAAALAKDLEALLEEARAGLRLASEVLGERDALGERAALRAATVRVDGAAVVVEAPWPYEALDRACERLAADVRASLPNPPAK